MNNRETILRDIPVAYQSTVNAFMDQQIADTDCTTDNDILTLLKNLQTDFKKGYYITPDGEMAFLDIDNPDQLYANGGVDTLTADNEADSAAADRKQTLYKAAGLGVILVAFLVFILVSRSQRTSTDRILEDGETAVVQESNDQIDATPTTFPLQEIENQNESLETIGGLGGSLTLGRPASIEIHYKKTDDVVALPIDPALVPPQGGLPFDAARMESENPVAVWVFGTVLNYNIGIPDAFARNIQPGDEIIINTDTGNSLRFITHSTFDGNNYDPARQLSQDHIGVTLFSLPAPADNQVRFITADYDMTMEDTAVLDTHTLTEDILLANGSEIKISQVMYEHTFSGAVRFLLAGESTPNSQFLLALSSGNVQTESIAPIQTDDQWTAEFLVPDSFTGQAISAEIRAVPSNELLFVTLGIFPRLDAQLKVSAQLAYWQAETQTAVIHLSISNTGEQQVHVGPTFFKLTGGNQTQRREIPLISTLPIVLEGNEAQSITLSFSLRTVEDQLILQAGTSLYAIQLVETP